MKISQVKIENFRSYSDEVSIDINDLTTFVGKNDVGKSTVLEALDIFFNDKKSIVKMDKEDVNRSRLSSGDTDIRITVVFTDLPESIIIDESNETSLSDEYLLGDDGNLYLSKVYPNGGAAKVYVRAQHPQNPICSDLLHKKNAALKKIVNDNSIDCQDKTRNAVMRKAIWTHFADSLDLNYVDIDLNKEDAKNIWEQLKEYLPVYSLFQSDRKNSDGDTEIQDPMKVAVQEIMKDQFIKDSLREVAEKVTEKLKVVADGTCEKLREMNPELASTLNPVVPSAEQLKWNDVFKSVSIAGDDDIPLNKRGSGVKRLVLLNFFRAEAERRKSERNVPDVIYAIEEPETSQHLDHQSKLIKALLELSNAEHTQVLLTTHSSYLVKMHDFADIRLVKNNESTKEVVKIDVNNLPYPSLNEVNYLAFGDISEEYHNELYGYIEENEWLTEYNAEKEKIPYNKKIRGGVIPQNITRTDYIRHQIHHPENTENVKYTFQQLEESILQMRSFIGYKNQTTV